MRHRHIRRPWHQPRPIRHPPSHRPLHLVVDLQDHALRPVLAIQFLILAFDNPERLHNIIHILARNPIQKEIRCVQLAAQQEARIT